MFLFTTPYFYFQQYGSTRFSFNDFPILLVVLSALVWLTAGYIFGSITWSTMERAYEVQQHNMDSNRPAR